ncbi:MAG: hypothetical protein JWO47_1040 [Candidatus Saccharibacteria bacterium]|nr:hypothetical protein [Candidatus Saccharibacteria bacterium]
MKAAYEGKTLVAGFPIFQEIVLENYGIPPSSQQELFGKLAFTGAELEKVSVGYELEGRQVFRSNVGEMGVNWHPHGREIRDVVWKYGGDDIRSLLIGGSIVRASWYALPRDQTGAERLFSPTHDELCSRITTSELMTKAVSALVATNDELVDIGSVPRHALGWNAAIHEMADSSEQAKIRASLQKTYFGNEMLDSEDSHTIGSYISEEDSAELRDHFIGLALRELEQPGCRGKLFIMMDNLLGTRPLIFTKETFNRYRRIKNKPEIRGTYEDYLDTSNRARSSSDDNERVLVRSNREILDKASDKVLELAKQVAMQAISS